jgi:Na+-translocating ferredoxin:NAD+ oxidoreductase RnfC subunit
LRYDTRNARLARDAGERAADLTSVKSAIDKGAAGTNAVQAAILRARAKKAAATTTGKP